MERAIDDEMLPDELFDDLALASSRRSDVQAIVCYRQGRSALPHLTRTSRPSTDDSDSVSSASLSSSETVATTSMCRWMWTIYFTPPRTNHAQLCYEHQSHGATRVLA